MADTKISLLTDGVTASGGDQIPVARSGANKYITPAYIATYLGTAFQPLDSDLTAIAALTTTSFGRSLLALADAAALRTTAGLVIGTDVQAPATTLAGYGITDAQPLDSDLTAIAALTTTSFGRSLLALADAAAGRTALAAAPLAAKYIVQTADSELSAEQALGALATGLVKNTTTTGVLSIAVADTDYATPGGVSAAYQPLDSDLTTLAGLTATTDNFLVSVASAWASRTPAQVKTTLSLSNVENTALSTWAGSANITTLGTIATGTWQGTKIGLAYGGSNADLSATGGANQFVRQNSVGGVFTVSTLAAADLPATAVTAAAYGSATQSPTFTVDAQGRITAAANVTIAPVYTSITYSGLTTGHVFQATGAAAAAFAALNLATAASITGVLPSANGGTGVANDASASLTLPNTATTISGGGTLALGGFTLTVPTTGSAALLATANVFTAAQEIDKNGIAATSTDGLILTNATAAAAGAQQWSPRLRLTGQGWKTTATAASQTVDWIIENLPVQGSTNPSTQLVFSSQINGGGYTERMRIGSNSTILLPTAGEIDFASNSTSIRRYTSKGINLTGAGDADYALNVSGYNSNAFNASSGTFGNTLIDGTFNSSSGAAKFIGLHVNPTINQTGSASGGYTALQVNVVETAALGTNKLAFDVQYSGTSKFKVGSGGISFFNAAVAAQQTGGQNLTNNVTSGGTTGQIDDFTGAVYATDSLIIRNDIYQLARMLKQDHDALRLFGFLT